MNYSSAGNLCVCMLSTCMLFPFTSFLFLPLLILSSYSSPPPPHPLFLFLPSSSSSSLPLPPLLILSSSSSPPPPHPPSSSLFFSSSFFFFSSSFSPPPPPPPPPPPLSTEICNDSEIVRKQKWTLKVEPANGALRTYYMSVGAKRELYVSLSHLLCSN